MIIENILALNFNTQKGNISLFT